MIYYNSYKVISCRCDRCQCMRHWLYTRTVSSIHMSICLKSCSEALSYVPVLRMKCRTIIPCMVPLCYESILLIIRIVYVRFWCCVSTVHEVSASDVLNSFERTTQLSVLSNDRNVHLIVLTRGVQLIIYNVVFILSNLIASSTLSGIIKATLSWSVVAGYTNKDNYK